MQGTEAITDYGRYLTPTLLIIAALIIGAVLIWLASLPGERARRRRHPHARAIAVIGWLSVLIWPLWFVAMAWSASEPGWWQEPAQLHVPVSPTRLRADEES